MFDDGLFVFTYFHTHVFLFFLTYKRRMRFSHSPPYRVSPEGAGGLPTKQRRRHPNVDKKARADSLSFFPAHGKVTHSLEA